MKLLGIDYGEKHVGLALGDSQDGSRVDIGVLSSLQEKDIIKKIQETVAEEHIERIVIGLPLTSSGERFFRTQQVETFGYMLQKACNVPVAFEDERFTSAVFKRIPSRYRQGKSIDALSAVLILEGHMERTRLEE